MLSVLPWILILIILGLIGFFMTQQYRDMHHALREMDVRLQEEALRTQELEGGMQELSELLMEKWSLLEDAMSQPLHEGKSTVTGRLWKLDHIQEEDHEGSDVDTIPVEEVDDLLSKLEDEVVS
jgi:hypothetical protein